MQRVDKDENIHLRGDDDYVRVPAKHKGRTTGHADLETTEGLCADPPAGNVDSHKIVCSWCAQAHVSIHSCDFTNGYFQGQEIDVISLYHITKGEATSGVILLSLLSIYGTKSVRAGVMNLVLQKFLTSKDEHGAKGHTVRVQPITHDARCDSTREPTTSGVHQEKFNSRFLAWIARQTLSDPLFRISKIQNTFEKCSCQKLTCARLHIGICSIRLHEQYQFLFQIILEIKRLSRDSATTVSVMNKNNLMESSGTLESQQANITALEPGDALDAVSMLIHLLSA